MKISLPGKLILGDYFQGNRTSRRPFLLLRISFPGRPIFTQLPPRETLHVRRRNEKNPYLKGKIELVHASGVDRVLHQAKLDLTKVMATS